MLCHPGANPAALLCSATPTATLLCCRAVPPHANPAALLRGATPVPTLPCCRPTAPLPQKVNDIIMFGGEFCDPDTDKVYVYSDLYRYHVDKDSWTRISSPNRCRAACRLSPAVCCHAACRLLCGARCVAPSACRLRCVAMAWHDMCCAARSCHAMA